VLLLIYAAYFALRSALDNQEQKMQLSAVYSILAFVTVPFLIFVIPRIIFSLHPENPIMSNDPEMEMTSKIRIVFFASLFGFSLLYFLILRMKVELEFIRNKFASVGETT
ncbi:MAG: cytochrome C biogenesis protein, partial [bacterium]